MTEYYKGDRIKELLAELAHAEKVFNSVDPENLNDELRGKLIAAKATVAINKSEVDFITGELSMAKNRCSNSDARRFIEYRDAFMNHTKTMFGEWRRVEGGDNPKDVYAVYSYGYHFPMYIWDDEARVWVGNKDKYSRTTTTHQNKARPQAPIAQWFDTETCRRITYSGLAGTVANRME